MIFSFWHEHLKKVSLSRLTGMAIVGLAIADSVALASAQNSAVVRGAPPQRETMRVDPEGFAVAPPKWAEVQAQGAFDSLLCENNTQTGCYVDLGRLDDHDRCREEYIRVFGDDGREYRVNTNQEVLLPVKQEAMRARRRVGAEESTIVRRVEGTPVARTETLEVVKRGGFNLRWECGAHEENQQTPLVTAAADAVKVDKFSSYVFVTPLLWRPRGAEIGDASKGEFVGRLETGSQLSTGEQCSKSRITIYGKDGREIRLSQGVRQIVEVNSSRTNTQVRWECGGYVENRTIKFPMGTDALDVHFTTKDNNAFGSSKRIRIMPVTWRSYWRYLTPQEREQSRAAAVMSIAKKNNLGAQVFMANKPRLFEYPKINGKRVDLCLSWGKQCGQPAADEFCKKQGYSSASGFTVDRDIGGTSPTFVMADGLVCSEPACDGFRAITCTN